MGDDIKSLGKKVAEFEKRLKFNEARIKMLVDTMANSKDIEKYLDVLYKKMGRDLAESEKISQRLQDRQIEMSDRANEARIKESDREWEKETRLQKKEIDKIVKDAERTNKDLVRQAEMTMVLNRLATVEAVVKSAMSRK